MTNVVIFNKRERVLDFRSKQKAIEILTMGSVIILRIYKHNDVEINLMLIRPCIIVIVEA